MPLCVQPNYVHMLTWHAFQDKEKHIMGRVQIKSSHSSLRSNTELKSYFLTFNTSGLIPPLAENTSLFAIAKALSMYVLPRL